MIKNSSLVVVALTLTILVDAISVLAQSQAPAAPQQQSQPSLPDPSKLSDLKFKDEKVEDRLKVCAVILQEQALPMVGKGYTEHYVSEIYATKIRDLDAVVFNAQMTDPKSSRLYYLKVVGIPDPDSEAGLLAFSLSDSTLSDVKSKEDQSTKGFALRVLHSLKFID